MSTPSFEEWQEKAPKEDIFDKDYLESLGFYIVSDDGQYGKATFGNGATVIQWNRWGHHCTYYGKPIEEYNCSFSIRKDGGTRYAFNGYVFSRKDIERLLEMTW